HDANILRLCSRSEALLPTPIGASRFVIRATRERGVGVPPSRSLVTASREAIHHTTAATPTPGHRHNTIEKQPSEPWPGMCNAQARHTSSNGESGSAWLLQLCFIVWQRR